MKNLLALIPVLLLFFSSCSDDNAKPKEITLEVSKNELLFSSGGGNAFFDISSNDSWIITQIPAWIEIDVTEGEGDLRIRLIAEVNPKEEERSATIKITATDKYKEILIKQSAKNVTLSLSEAELIFAAEPTAAGLTFDIATNESWIITDIPDWCTLSEESGDENATITVIVEKNYIDTEREAVIYVKAGSKTEELKITQEALEIQLAFGEAGYPEYTSSNKMQRFDFYENSGDLSVLIKSNTKWTVASDSEWCIPDREDGIEDGTLAVNVGENTTSADRTGEITISAGTKSLKVLVKQGGLIQVDETNPYQINKRDNAPRIGDILRKKQVNYVDPGNAGENVTWNFSSLTVTNNDYKIEYSAAPTQLNYNDPYIPTYIMGYDKFDITEPEANSLFICTEYYTMYYFQIKNNLLNALGHENPVTKLQYNPRMISDKYPTYYNDTYKYDYETNGYYSGTEKIETEGYKEMKADGYGTIVLPSGTYNNALRIKYVQRIEEEIFNGVSYVDYIREYTTYKWYVKGYRYPVLEIYRIVDLNSGTELSKQGFYYPPTDHTYLQNTRNVNVNATTIKGMPHKEFSREESILPIMQLK
ncbi:BACON domain-containing protein [Dysgonomonas sp. 25]|uniref:BACON domain-containing protein n=1 Tax=Dysgonomonas sp. 25 TaxID=2302933 RepID=UPI0013D6F205|nr:BACON domain-containing protein [Dysgonomonas sp. 25]NDV69439.1 hypothetical protein [Dysgonomonas sp. 25]